MQWLSFILFFIVSVPALDVWGQREWKLQKQEDEIRIYTAHQEGTRILAYRIEAFIRGELTEVYHQVIDFQGNKKYLETVKELRVLEKDPDRKVLVYMMFDLPWPFRDRDFVNRMALKIGSDTISLSSSPATGFVEPKEDVVRMKEFSEQWLLIRKNPDTTHLSLRGYADPAGTFPPWLVNRFVVKEPHALVRAIKQQVENEL